MPWEFDPDKGLQYVAKVLKARVITAREFDETNPYGIKGGGLSAQIGPDSEVLLYEVLNLEASQPGTTRRIFMTEDHTPVSKFSRWCRAHKNLGLKVEINPDGTTNVEGRYFVVRELDVTMKTTKFGDKNTFHTMEPVGIPSPEEIEALEKGIGIIAEPQDLNEVAQTILSIADGLTPEALLQQMESLGFANCEKVLNELKAKQSIITQEGFLKVV